MPLTNMLCYLLVAIIRKGKVFFAVWVDPSVPAMVRFIKGATSQKHAGTLKNALEGYMKALRLELPPNYVEQEFLSGTIPSEQKVED